MDLSDRAGIGIGGRILRTEEKRRMAASHRTAYSPA